MYGSRSTPPPSTRDKSPTRRPPAASGVCATVDVDRREKADLVAIVYDVAKMEWISIAKQAKSKEHLVA
jgi:hypothetical protein